MREPCRMTLATLRTMNHLTRFAPLYSCFVILLAGCELVRLDPIGIGDSPGDTDEPRAGAGGTYGGGGARTSGGGAGTSAGGSGGSGTASVCGNGVVENPEQCDDANDDSSDGCNACSIADGWSCSGTPSTCTKEPDAVSELALGGYYSCALSTTGNVRCWGRSNWGQLGYGNTDTIGDDETPASAGNVDIGGKVQQISAAGSFTCALLETGDVRCWGYGDNGRLGYGNTNYIGDDETPASAGNVDIGGKVQQISVGGFHACALLRAGNVRCWGTAGYSALGYGNSNDIGDDETPASAGDVDVGGTVKQITTGHTHTCALLTAGTVRCWGSNVYGQLGYGNTHVIGDDETPASAGDVDVGGTVKQIAARSDHTCALLTAGTVRCWGGDAYGELGYGRGTQYMIGDDETPASAGDVDVGGAVKQIAVGVNTSCALLETGAVRCWGLGGEVVGGGAGNGQLGYGNTNNIGDDETPASAGDVDVGGAVQQIASGSIHNCALLTTGTARCWGDNNFGALGYGNANNIGDDETPASAGDVSIF